MATLANALPKQSLTTALIIPERAADAPSITLSFQQLQGRIEAFQSSLAALGIGHDSAVSIALPNSLEFIVRFTGSFRYTS
jgi:oxalate---CoA ligase